MGVHGLWDLLAPVGRRVSVETLSGKKLAIDASIWIVQFMKAMRDEKGEMVRNAHLIGFFRRICKLLFLRTKPVFVFDGATPALKRRTVIARRRHRENAQAKIRKTAEKLLLNHLKAMRLKELSEDLENQRKKQESSSQKNNDAVSEHSNHEKLDEMLAASIAAEENENLKNIPSTSVAPVPTGKEENTDEDEELILPEMDGNVDPDVLAALPPSMQLEFLMRESSIKGNRKNNKAMKKGEKNTNDVKGKEILSDDNDLEESNLERDEVGAESYSQDKLDEMLAASIAAEEDASLNKKASSSGAAIPSEEEGGDEDEEMILPAVSGKVDPAVLAALPPSMQLDLLVQMRERLMAENRQKYQKVKKAPEKFSELQIEAYLKTVAFRREIDQVQKSAAGQAVGGVQTSRIASEANREFIFSSSFTGDKQLFTSGKVQRNEDTQQQTPRENPVSENINNVMSIDESNTVTGLVLDESGRVFDNSVETYLDERGRIRVSRVRAMGMRMTRDLQRNLDLMKEIEREKTRLVKTATAQSALNRSKGGAAKSDPSKCQQVKSSNDSRGNSVNLDKRNEESNLNNESSLQISFEVDGGSKCFDSDDDIFSTLVAGKYSNVSFVNNGTSTRQLSDAASDSDWEEGIIEGKVAESFNDIELASKPSLEEGNSSDNSEVEWEEGVSNACANSSCLAESGKPLSRGRLEEDADLQEAIRRSLDDLAGEEFNHTASDENFKSSGENAFEGVGSPGQEDNNAEANVLGKESTEQNKSCAEISRVEELDGINISEAFAFIEEQCDPSEAPNIDISHSGPSNVHKIGNLHSKTPSLESVGPPLSKVINLMGDSSDSFVKDDGLAPSTKMPSGEILSNELQNIIFVEDERNDMKTKPSILINNDQLGSASKLSCHSVETTKPSVPCMASSARDSINDIGTQQNVAGPINSDLFDEKEHDMDKSADIYIDDAHLDFTKASLEEEILNLGQERMNLGDEQRKLERNAESVTSEMFAECQELLQMFGLPYIIAPMEAEAQCAYMELSNLVDGVVTDDSDVFLFGAQSVYKNIFDDRKYVETYFMKDIEKELGLTREKLIRMALLLGSDYTEGVSGIGIVNAIEVVNAFPEENGLHKFREWIESPDPTILGKFDAQTGVGVKKKGSKVIENDLNCTSSHIGGSSPSGQNTPQSNEEQQFTDLIEEIKQIFMDKHRNVSKNWHIPPSFPSDAVVSAYSCPQVDKSTEPFSWGKPDLHLLRRLCWEKFGWGIQKSDDLLLPVLKEYNKHETQLRIEAFYTFNERFAKIRSKRIKKAVKGITGNQSADGMDETAKEASKNRKGRRIRPADSDRNKSGKTSNKTVQNVLGKESNSLEKLTVKQSRKRRTIGEPFSSEAENTCKRSQAEGRQRLNKGSNGHGKGRGRGRGQGMGVREEGYLGSEQSDSSSGDVSSGSDMPEINVEKLEGPQVVRRSTRSRKPVHYALNDLEIDDLDNSLDEGDRKGYDEKAAEESLLYAEGVSKDATMGFNDKEQHKVENSSLEGFFSSYHETGGGFCIDEAETGRPAVSEKHYPFKVDVSEDYLKIGGGFCMDEGEKREDQSAGCSSPAAPDREPANVSYLSGIGKEDDTSGDAAQSISGVKRAMNELPHAHERSDDAELNVDFVNATYPDDHSEVGVSPPESTKNNTGASSVEGLTAMPFLKRKRRKS